MIYCFRCPNSECGLKQEFVKPIGAASSEQPCPHCNTSMVRDYAAERPHVRGKDYRRLIVSDSLGMNPNQVEEHRKMFPDIKVLDDGRPVFENFDSHDKYLKKCGFYKAPQRQRKHSVVKE